MLINGPSADQIRNRAGVSFVEAMCASYMASASENGWSLAEFVERTGVEARHARQTAYRFGIRFSDYDPEAVPVQLVWRDNGRGKGWTLLKGSDAIGECQRTDDGKYTGQACGAVETGWATKFVFVRIAEKLDALSPDLFGGKPVEVFTQEAKGARRERIFPADDDKLRACRSALRIDRDAA